MGRKRLSLRINDRLMKAIVCGAYMLRLENIKAGLLEPFKCLLREKASRNMLIAALLFSFLAVFFKKAIVNSSPYFSLCITHLLGVLLLSCVFTKKKRLSTVYHQIVDHFGLLFLNGIAAFLTGWALFAAF